MGSRPALERARSGRGRAGGWNNWGRASRSREKKRGARVNLLARVAVFGIESKRAGEASRFCLERQFNFPQPMSRIRSLSKPRWLSLSLANLSLLLSSEWTAARPRLSPPLPQTPTAPGGPPSAPLPEQASFPMRPSPFQM